jgi:hypothetical protein
MGSGRIRRQTIGRAARQEISEFSNRARKAD